MEMIGTYEVQSFKLGKCTNFSIDPHIFFVISFELS